MRIYYIYHNEKSDYTFIRAVDSLNSSNLRTVSKELLDLSLRFCPNHLDSLEALGVIFAEEKNYKKAHELMDQIIKISPNHVMARSNKSLFYMREGKIEAAEKEKELAAKLSIGSMLEDSEDQFEDEQVVNDMISYLLFWR